MEIIVTMPILQDSYKDHKMSAENFFYLVKQDETIRKDTDIKKAHFAETQFTHLKC